MKQIKYIFRKNIFIIFGMAICLLFSGCNVDEQTVILSEQESESACNESEETVQTGKERIYVHVCGEVKKPGVYGLKSDARINDAVKKAGGFTKKADSSAVNLASSLVDGQQVMIPRKGKQTDAAKETVSDDGSGLSVADSEGKVNINTASKEELMTLPGIGQARAGAIIAYRQNNGNFHQIEDIMNVSGIKQAAFSKIKDQIIV